jgi:hypothetical protein
MKIHPIIPVVEQCAVRTYKDRWERFTWFDLICMGERGNPNGAW